MNRINIIKARSGEASSGQDVRDCRCSGYGGVECEKKPKA